VALVPITSIEPKWHIVLYTDDEADSALQSPDDTAYWARSNSTEYELGCESDHNMNH